MKVTKEYLRELIRESLEEVASLGTRQRQQLRRFSQKTPAGGMPEPQDPESELDKNRWQIRQLNVNTGILNKQTRSAHRTDLMQKGFYVDHIDSLGYSSAYGPFESEEAARKFVLDARKKASAEVGKQMSLDREEEN